MDPSRPINLNELEELALAKLEPLARDYFRGGAGDEVTLSRNRADWQEYKIWPRMLREVDAVDLATSIAGTHAEAPILIAPTAFHRMAHPDGELATAEAAKACGAIFVVSSLSTTLFQNIAAVGASWWLQLYINRDWNFTVSLIDRAVHLGARAIEVTLDAPVWGVRERDLRNGFHLPDGIAAVNLTQSHHEADWLQHHGAGMEATFDWMLAPKTSWNDFEKVCRHSPVPVLAKGILHPDDARLALEHGAKGVVVSNHGGRQLDGAPSSAAALPGIVHAVAGSGTVLVDGGIRRGMDVLRALALGAQGVQIGRPIIWGLAWRGEEGAQWVIHQLTQELEQALILAGARSIAELDGSWIESGSHFGQGPR